MNDQAISDLIVFTSPESDMKIEVMFADEMFWFSQKMMAELFGTTVANINIHLKNMYQSAVLQKDLTIKDFLIVQTEGKREIRRKIGFYHLDAVIAVGLHINNQQAIRFKQWATQTLRKHILTAGKPAKQQVLPADPHAQDIRSGDALIHCETSGPADAPVLVLLHGNGEDLHIFDTNIRYFSQYYRTVAIDTRGHGQSTRGTAPFDFYTFAADLVAVLDKLQIDKAHVVGFSDGAITALHLALTAPKCIASMILLGANYDPKGLRWTSRLVIRLVYIWLFVTALFSASYRKRKEIWSLMVYQPNLTIEEISRITVPTLAVTGENDMVSQRQNDEISRAIVGSKRLIISDSDHFWMFKMPEMFHQTVMKFLQDINNDGR